MARMTEDELIKLALDRNMSSEEALAFFEKGLSETAAPAAAPSRPAPTPRPAPSARPVAPRPAAPKAAQAMAAVAAPPTPRAAPVEEPAVEAMLGPVAPVGSVAVGSRSSFAPTIRELTGEERAQRELADAREQARTFQLLREEQADKAARELEKATRGVLLGEAAAVQGARMLAPQTTFTAGMVAPLPEAGVMVKYGADLEGMYSPAQRASRMPSAASAAKAAGALYAVPKAAYVGLQLASLLGEMREDTTSREQDERVLASRASEPYFVDERGRRVTAEGLPFENQRPLTTAERAVLSAKRELAVPKTGAMPMVVAEAPRSGTRRVFEGLTGSVQQDVQELEEGLSQSARTLKDMLGTAAEVVAPYTLPGISESVGRAVLGERRKLTPEDAALSSGGALAANLRAVKTNPSAFLAVGPDEQPYSVVMTPEEAYASANEKFSEWAKRFPERAATARSVVEKRNAQRQTERKLSAGVVPAAPMQGVRPEEQERLRSVTELPREAPARSVLEQAVVPLPTPEELGVTEAQWFSALRKAGVTRQDVDAAVIGADVNQRLRAVLARP